MKGFTAECKNCGKEFEKFGKQKFCCLNCGKKYRRAKKEQVTLTCKVCGKTFQASSEKRKTCSKKCSAAYAKSNYGRLSENKEYCPPYLSRPFTQDTENLCKIWLCQGDSMELIAEVLDRPVRDIEYAVGGKKHG
ncbi:MAG: hypothetical protein RR263_00590 [Oscillospiraceae bacterium]